MTDNSIALLARYAADSMEIRTSEEARLSAISGPSGFPPNLPVRSVMQEQTGSSRLHIRHPSGYARCPKADILRRTLIYPLRDEAVAPANVDKCRLFAMKKLDLF